MSQSEYGLHEGSTCFANENRRLRTVCRSEFCVEWTSSYKTYKLWFNVCTNRIKVSTHFNVSKRMISKWMNAQITIYWIWTMRDACASNLKLRLVREREKKNMFRVVRNFILRSCGILWVWMNENLLEGKKLVIALLEEWHLNDFGENQVDVDFCTCQGRLYCITHVLRLFKFSDIKRMFVMCL
jgi:hypothetical protein